MSGAGYAVRVKARAIFGGLALGAAFGALTSLVNAASSPFCAMGGQVAQAGWGWPARVASLMLGAGWAWASA